MIELIGMLYNSNFPPESFGFLDFVFSVKYKGQDFHMEADF